MDERSNHNLPSVVDLYGGPFWTPVPPFERWWGNRDHLREKKGSRDQRPMVVFAVAFLSLAAPLRSGPRRFVRLANPLGTLIPLGVSHPSNGTVWWGPAIGRFRVPLIAVYTGAMRPLTGLEQQSEHLSPRSFFQHKLAVIQLLAVWSHMEHLSYIWNSVV